MRGLLTKIFDLLIPRSKDSVRADAVTEEMLRTRARLAVGPLVWIYSLFLYRDADIRAIVRSIKYRANTAPLAMLGVIAAEELIAILADKQTLGGWERVIVAPIPSSKKRLRERGYNQAERISAAIVAAMGKSVEHMPHLLARIERESQTRLSYEKRKENVAGAFSLPRADAARGRCIVLIDDVVESGATLSDARRTLLEAGAKDVIAFVIAR